MGPQQVHHVGIYGAMDGIFGSMESNVLRLVAMIGICASGH